MSRGPGRVERAIETTFEANPSRIFSVETLATIAYPGVNRVERKHRVAVIRSADKVARRLGWVGRRPEKFGGSLIYFNLLDVRSYALGKLRTDFIHNSGGMDEIERLLDDPAAHMSRWSWVQPTGAWFKHVEIHKLEHVGRMEEAKAMCVELNELVSRGLC